MITRTFLLGKLHRATITEANLDYIGSITIDADLMDRAGLYEGEKVAVWNITNGERIETYAIKGPRGSRCVKINGGAAHRMHVGDRVVIAWFGQSECQGGSIHPLYIPEPTVILLGDANEPEEM
jgi:aspartate 1-decarboxylase